jgi:hypothetical protein
MSLSRNEPGSHLQEVIKKSEEYSKELIEVVAEPPSKDYLDQVDIQKLYHEDSDFNSADLSSSTMNNDLYTKLTKTCCKIECVQFYGRLVVELADCAAPVYLLNQILPITTMPYAIMVRMGSFVFNDRVGECIHALITKPDPFSGLRADGHGSVYRGIIKQGVKKGTTVMGIFMFGYGLGTLVMNYGENLNKIENPTLKSIIKVPFKNMIYSIPLLGLTGCGLNKLSLAVWNYCWPEQKEESEKGRVNLLQILGQYTMSYYGAFALDTMIAWHLLVTGIAGRNDNPRVAMLRLMSCYALHESLQYVLYPKPHVTRMNVRQTYSIQDAAENMDTIPYIQPSYPSYRQGFYHMTARASINLFMLGMGYLADIYITCTAAPELCEENTFGNHAIRSGVALGGVLLTDYLAEKVVPNIYRLGCSFFYKHKRDSVYHSLLIESDEDIENNQTSGSFERHP